jgi:hypothetical protein
VTLPRCRCGRKAVAVAPGSVTAYDPDHVLIERAKPLRAWCQRCAEARGWLVAPGAMIVRGKAAAARSSPRAAARAH